MSNSPTDATSTGGSRLFYCGTRIEVCLGDRVRWKRWFRPDLEGTVCYLPGISPPHPGLEYEDVRQWAIKAADGTVWAMGYYPEQAQPKKNLRFVARSEERGIGPETTLE